MGLREMKAARMRDQLVDVALELFLEHGYEETTMEQIAERAEVGSSTLYRYFPSKDLLILDRFIQSLTLGDLLRERPAGEPLDIALGTVIHESLSKMEDSEGRFAALRRIVDAAPVPRARLWDFVAQSRTGLEVAIGERMSLPPTDLLVRMTAGTAFVVYELAGETWWAGDHATPAPAVIESVIRSLSTLLPVLPALPPR